MNIKGEVLVLGSGKTGKSVYSFFKEKNVKVLVVNEEIESKEIDFFKVNSFDSLNPLDYKLIVQSPGIARDIDFLKRADKLGVEVIGEIELAYRNIDCPIIAITGTNGKTTTVSFINHIAKSIGLRSEVAGNIGRPLIELVGKNLDLIVLEASSYQLETITKFRSKVGIITNITPDHLERHKTMDKYLNIKRKIFVNARKDDFKILNRDDSYLIKSNESKNTYWFSLGKKVKGAYLKGDEIYLNLNNDSHPFFNINNLKVIGSHNIENAMTSILGITLFLGREVDLYKGLSTFKGVEHRLEFIRKIAGISIYNDSKSTNPEATIKAIESFEKGQYFIVGGSSKNVSYIEMGKCFMENESIPIIQGATQDEIAKVFDSIGVKYHRSEDIFTSLNIAISLAECGNSIILSPGCASFDKFKNFEERGDKFKEYVNGYKKV